MKTTTEQPSCNCDLQRLLTTICPMLISTLQFRLLRSNARAFVALLFFMSGLMFTSQKLDAQCNSFGIDFKQGANRDGGYEPGQIHWIGSILQNSNSRYIEGMSTLQRIVLNNLPSCGDGYHSLRIKMQSRKLDNHAYDFLTSWDNAFLAAAAIAPGFDLFPASRTDMVNDLNECGDEISACAAAACGVATGGTFADLPIIDGETNLLIEGPPADQNTVSQIIPIYESRYGDRTVRVYVGPEGFGGTPADNQVVFVGYGDSNPNDGGDSYIYYDIKWVSTSPNVVIEFGAHISVGVDGLAVAPSLGVGYLLNRGASDISGGPYHVIVEDFQPTTNNDPNCEPNLGNLDNQLQGSEILLFPSCRLDGPSSVCASGTATYTATVTNPSDATYLWEIINTGGQSPAASIIGTPSGDVPAPIEPAMTTPLSITVNTGGVGTYTVKLTITNGGQTSNDADDDIVSSCTVTTTVNPGPALTCPPNTSTGACQTQAQVDAAYQAWLATASGSPGITHNGGTAGPNKCGGTTTVIFTATNSCGTATCSATFTVTPDTPPVFTGSYADVTLGCSPADPTGSLGTASATDNCGATTITSSDGAISSDGCNRSRTRTFTATDECNNTATISRTVRWISDNTPPIITTGGTTTTLGCNPSASDINGALGTATATDVCGTPTEFGEGPLPPSSCISGYKGNNGGGNCPDLNGQPATGKVTLFFTSALTVAPTILSVTDNDPATDLSNVRFGPGVLSNDGLSAEYCYYDGPNNDNNLWGGGIILTFNLQSVNGQGCIVRVPQLRTPRTLVSQILASQVIALQTITTLTSSDGPIISNGCNRTQTRTWTAIDDCGNTATASRTVTWISDVTPPSFTGSYTDVNLGCNPANPDGSLGSASATDVCGAVTITQSDGAVVSNGCDRSRTRTFTARDGCNNTSTTSRTVRWIADVTPPSFTGSYTDVNLGCNPANPDGSLGSASATDACGAVTITQSDGAVVSSGCDRSRTRTFTATDGCLNTSTTSRTVRWIADVTPPSFTGSYTDVNLGCNPANPDGSLGSASATDACGAVTITQSDGAVVSNGCDRSRTRTFTARDGCNNTSTTSRTVRWIADVTPPSFTGSYTDVNLGCNPANPDGSLGSASATDACGAVTITQSDGAVVSSGCDRSRTRTFTARDGCNNTSTTSRTVRWIADVTPPSFTGSYTDVNLGCNPANPDGSLGSASATDACGAVTITQSDGAVVSNGCDRSRTRTFTARDGCNNTSTTSRTVRWIADVTPPSFTGSYTDVNLGCNPANPDGSLGSASATDACGAVTITQSDGAVVSNGCDRSRTRTFTARDGCNNTSTTSRTVRWIADVTPPSFTGSYTDVNLGCNPANPDGSLGSASATDACGAVTITQSDGAVVSNGCDRSRTRTFTARDGCNNTSTTSRTVRWIADVTPPSFTGSYTDVNLGCNPANPDGSLGSASATDVCGAVTITQSDGAVVSNGCDRSRTRTFTARDGCNNTSTTSRTVRWIADVTPPSFTGSYTDVNLGCNPANPDGSLGSASATDVCGAVTITQSDGAVVSNGCDRSRTRTFTARDGCNNTSTTSRTVRWIADVTPPSFTGSYTDVNLGCNPANPDGSLGSASATDACGAVTITQSDGAVVSNGCDRSRTRTFTARDGCNNTSTTSRTVRWIADVTPPSFTGSYTDVNLGCNPANPDGSLGSASATDVCGAVTITQSDGAVVSNGCDRSRTRTFTARDGCNNTSTTSRTVRWIADVTPPSFTGSYTDVNLGCNPANPDGSLGSASATDACGAVTITQSDGAVVSNGCDRSRTRTFTARDGCNNTSTTSRTVRWIADVTPPSFTGSYTDVNLGCNPANPDGSLGSASATDVCGAVTITQSDGAVVSNGCDRSRTRTFTARDGCNNTSTTSRTVRWIADVTPPSFTGSYTDVNLGCNPANPDGSLGSASATDACGAVTITQSDGAVVSNGCDRSRTRTFTARDGCNNTSTTSRTVRWIADVTPPSFTGSYTDVNLGCNPANPDGSLGSASATDACGAVTITQSDGAVVSNGCDRSRTRTFTARDGCNNTSTTSRTVRWISDVTPPSFTGSYTDVNLGCNPANPDGSLGSASATDACGAVTITQSDGAVVSNGCDRSRTRTFTARDGCNNTSTTSRTVRWIADVTPPSFTGSYTDVNLGCNPANPDGSLGSASATDACGAVTITQSDGAVVSSGCDRSRTRTFTARDGCNNTSTTSRTVRWIADVTPPVLTTGGTTNTLGCNPSASDINAALGTASATDACTSSTETGGGPLPGSCIASYKGNNGGGNCPDLNGQPGTGKVTLFFNSVLTAAPTILSVTDDDPATDLSNVFFGPGELSNDGLSAEYCVYEGPNNNNNIWSGSVVLSFTLQFANGQGCVSRVSGSLSLTLTSSDGPVVSNGCSRSQTRTWIATDDCGNTATASRTVTWISDVTPPVLTTGGTTNTLGCNPSASDINAALGTASATDACGVPTVSSSDGTVTSTGCNRSQTRTWTARDACGNTSTASRTVTWISDVTPPSFTGSYTDVNLGCNPANPDVSLGSASATDACGAVTITQSDGAVVSNGCDRSRTRTFTARDGCNNTSTTSRTVRWIADVTPPSFTGSYTDVNLGCNPANPDVSLGSASATDACGAVTITQSDGAVVSNGCDRSRTRTFTARDGCNNTSTTSRTVRWIADVTPPSFTGSYTDVNLGCNPANPDGSLGSASATDACGAVTITQSDGAVVSNGCDRSRTRTFTARDGCNNTSTTSRTVRWIADVTPPSFTGSYTDVNLGCNPANPDGSLGSASATDACGAVTITQSDGAVVSNGCDRSRTRTFTARDGCNNTSTTSRTVRWIADVTPPSFTGSYTDVNLGCNPANPDGSLGSASATDACGAVTITQSDGAVVSNGCDRSRTRTFTARDGCNNTSTTSRTVRWIADVTPPSFTGSYTDVNLGCNPANPDGSLGSASATDVCGAVTITQSDGAVVSNGCDRSRTRTFTARDGCNNTSTTSRTVRWIADVTPPSFTGSYTDVNLGCNPANPDGSLGSASATDACGAVTITQSDGAVVSNGCDRSRTRTFTARDGCNNTSTTSRTVRWIADVTPPSFTGSYTDVNLGCNPANPDGSLGSASATDACGAVTITQSDGAVVSNGCDRSRTRTFTARDGCNNTSTTSRTVRWIADVTPPSFTGSYTDVNLGCNPANPDGSLGSASATDACGAVTITQSDGAVVSNGCDRSRTRTFTARDGCNNTSTTSRTVRWIADVTPPSFTGSYTDVNLGCNPANPDGSLGSASATDVCGAVTITQSDGAVVSNGCDRSRTRTFTARDGCNNTSTTSRTVRWIADVTPPSFTGSYTDVNLGCNPANPDGSLGSASATDACGAVTITQSDGAVVSNGCDRSRTRTFTARDGCNNTSTTSRTVRWISDVTPPSFTGSYTDVNLGCNPANPDGSLGSASATDVCGAVTITQSDGAVVSNGCDRSRTRTFTARDGCNNTSTTSRTVRWIADVTPPSFTGSYTDVNLGCNPANPDGSLGSASATDVCGAVTITQSDGAVVSNGCDRSRTRTFTARDGCNNTSTTSRTVRWIADVTPPSFTGSYTDVNLGCNPANPDGSLGSASATDACGAVTITQSDGAVVSSGCDRSRTRTFTARDGCNNTSTTSRTVRWIADVTPPSFTGSYTDVNLGCNPANPDGSLGSASATDACGAVTITQSDGAVVSSGCDRSRTRTFTARDGCNNTSTTSRTVRWIADVTPPSFTGSYTDVNLGCNPANPDGSLGSASATDVCGAVTITQSDGAVVSNGCDRSRTRTFTARDGCNNTSTTSRTVRWIADVTPPSFTGSYTDVNLGCNPANPDGSLGSASATDACGAVTITQSDGAVVSSGCDRSRTRTFTARDGCNNTSTTSRTVRWIADVTPPSFTGSYTDVNLGCNPANPDGSLGSASATDVCGAVTITQSDGAVVSNGCDRSRTRTFTARDGCNNTSTTSRTVRWIADVTPPSFTGSYTDVNLGCNPANPDGSLGSASATDACGAVTITQSDGAVVSSGCDRSRTRTFTARDGCNNTSTTSRTVRWIADVTPPSFTGSYTDVNLGCNPANPDGSLGSASATDVCGAVTITQSDGAVVSNGCDRSRTRTFTARDGCNNTSTTSRTVRWIADVTPPVLTTGGTTNTLGCNPSASDINAALGTATATDACGAATVSSSDGTVTSTGCNRSQTRTWTARDACGNTATASRTVTWISDVTPPVFTTTPASVDLDCSASVPSSVAPTATDACGTPTVTMTGSTDNPANCETGFNRIVTRTWTARDACGNTATYTQTIRVKCCETVCTLTQGAYGNPGGNICLPNGTTVNQTQIMIDALTAASGNMVVFGRQDLNRYWVVRLTDVNQGPTSNIFKMLPGGGPSLAFGLDNVAGVPEYNNGPSWPVVPLQQDGSIRNQLFSQTLTLYFNTTIAGSTLADVSLNGLAVIAPRDCGSSEPAGAGVPTQLVSPDVSSYLAAHGYAVTVAGLLQLANDALGGVNVSPLTLTQIQEAVSNINETFDECRILTGYVASGTGSGRVVTSNSISSQPALIVTAFPNPYKENFSLRINSPVTGQAMISFYTMSGVKIGEMKRDVVAMKDVWVPYNVPAAYRTRIVYTVSVGGSYNARGIVLSPN